MAIIVAVLNQKGGVGKTTLTINLGAALVEAGESVVLVDADPQSSLSHWKALGAEIPVVAINESQALKSGLQELSNDYSWVIVDSPAKVSGIVTTAINAAGLALVPIQPSPLDIAASRELFNYLKAKHEKTPNQPKVALVATRVVSNSRVAREVNEALKSFGFSVLESFTANRVAYVTSLLDGGSVFDSPDDKAIEEIQAIMEEIKGFIHG